VTFQQTEQLLAAAEPLGRARDEIEARFIEGGSALMIVHDVISRLLQALDSVAQSMEEGQSGGDRAALMSARARLLALPAAEEARQDHLRRLLQDTVAVRAMMERMKGTLAEVRVCATMTKITSAEMSEFAGFADDVVTCASDADGQIAFFAERLGKLHARLLPAGEEGGRTVKMAASAAPDLAGAFVAIADTMERKRAELDVLSAKVSVLARDLQSNVAVVLSSLQIGDMTRQRIEHVEFGLDALRELSASGEGDARGFVATASRLLAAQTEGLVSDFRASAVRVVDTLGSIARSAEAILEARGLVAAGADAADGGFLSRLDDSMDQARRVVLGIEAAHGRAAEIRASTLETADELLGNVGSIGNLSNVKDDMRCLAINAYLRCSRAGDKARAVGAVAMELQTLAKTLGAVTEQILGQVATLGRNASALADSAGESGLGDVIVELASGVRSARERMDRGLAEMDELGAAVASKVAATIAALDFERGLGDALAEAQSHFAASLRHDDEPADPADPRLEVFSSKMLAVYTMASEREVHRMIIPSAAGGEPEKTTIVEADDLFEDALF
jgi:hypothetical protein